ncbi:phosphoglycan beta 12 arabinosyltransferase (SCA1) [Leptomonas pyrrhocoris]|uniref:Phosphoglycan beta 12 arabinosyltransferase (SCA1) n=1 Tax=Leptomonas pyrrhocoris TaxID=157538 RepID=A0A0M9FS14_LEPPY|nr:phosphoglycan beta 12 arabinosyltransferase (SCA1) [Leptomonas pyrrhocoris]XP_015653324.1 phosphoglycan beta 12 arabinosyltransferase (SCA1) [Leptomonas pyrrhocoris]XP_015653325.1 phosphoglycan beta 12 arabinosyltransferase (SCA1) [Leptomonas pyrrhocoris]XP_015653326.1 phosphoglycan beta 12 arabinosyltransferase (SCA1) [Leptomonas pyrrhocoris]KPA74884.1 phosphoglycan beta 12 arabinosyltransferase (SCA1) [Leptomonas pyrrhocoris]KPA74885.1 phosphoglycan beta 12 arabinosyltransferase (SCA1) [L|eukprot:XP_015653323.1 phosphoglycan beta 12 arabinosyltransferase (SCA1) [Leptomonas pyrrhocoris]
MGDTAAFKGVNESVLPPMRVRPDDQACALCTDGLVYVHVGRAAHATEAVSAVAVQHTVTEVLHVRLDDAPTFSAGRGPSTAAWPSSSEVVSRCLAQLISLGLLGTAQGASLAHGGTAPRVSAAVLVDYDAAGAGTLVGRADRCPAFLAEVRPVAASAAAAGAATMDVSYPRLPSWPLRVAGGGGTVLPAPPYFGTATVRETDVDRDVQPPASVELTGDGSAVVVRFGRDEASRRPEPFEVVCPPHFMSVHIGRFGRQHNQVQEMLHTLALSHRTNRTFIVPVFAPENYIPYIRYDAQKVYGFNALRREGGYCLVSYAEARRVLKELEARGEPMSLRRLNYRGVARPRDAKQWADELAGDWWHVPPRTDAGGRRYNVDAWFEDSKLREPPLTNVSDGRADGMHFVETEDEFTAKDVFPDGGEEPYVRVARMRKAITLLVDLLGGAHESRPATKPQPRLAVLSSRMAFFVHPPLREQTRLMGLLRPAENITKEADRFYAEAAAAYNWPRLREAGDAAGVRGALKPGNFKGVIGFHIRRREGSCRAEALRIEGPNVAIDRRFQLDRANPSWSSPLSTVRNMELDCALTRTRVAELYRQYTQWMRHNMTEDAAASAQLVPTIFMAYDHQSGPIAEQVEQRLAEMWLSRQRSSTWGAATVRPHRFVASYDARVNMSFAAAFKAETRRLNTHRSVQSEPISEEERQVVLTRRLYDFAFAEICAMAVDFFMLTNVEVFRGSTLSSVSMNVIMRRWGRGLPCHGALPGYMVSYYTSMWYCLGSSISNSG